MPSSQSPNSWEGVTALAAAAGARWPELLAAQWALESGWGQHAPGHNYFGLKALPSVMSSQQLKTTEVVDGKSEVVKDSFLVFDSLKDCVQYLVDHWYKDYKTYKGVNNASSAHIAARELQKQGYATNPNYADKLIALMEAHGEKPVAKTSAKPVAKTSEKPVAKQPATPKDPLLFIQAQQATVLKKKPNQSKNLKSAERVEVEKGRSYPVLQYKELAKDSHVWVELGGQAGSWFIYLPHWQYAASGKRPSQLPENVAQIDWSNFNTLVTKNLTVGEVLQWDPRRAPQRGSAVAARIMRTAQEFQSIRNAYGKALGVTSFYRPEPINQQVGGVPGSRHTTGEAIDIYPISGSLEHFYQWIRPRWTGGLGDGRLKGFVHLDTRNGGHFVPGAGVRPVTEWDY